MYWNSGSRSGPIFQVDGGDQLAPFGEVAGEEDRERDLGELAGLEAERAEPHPDAGAVDVAPISGTIGSSRRNAPPKNNVHL